MTGLLTEVANLAAQLISGMALVAGAVVLAVTRRPSVGLAVLLDLLLAAGLLHLVGDPAWRVISTAAVIVALRKLLGEALRTGGRTRSRGRREPRRRSMDVSRLLRPAWRLQTDSGAGSSALRRRPGSGPR